MTENHDDLHGRLAHAARSAPLSKLDLERLQARRGRKETRRRVGALIVALTIGTAVVGGAALTLHQAGAGSLGAGGGAHDLVVPKGLAVPKGEYVYTRTAFVLNDAGIVSPWAETWWASDNSGRIDDPGPAVMFGSSGVYAADRFPNDTGELSQLSTDATTLEQQLIDRTGPNGASPEPYQEFTPGPGQDGHLTAGIVRAAGELLAAPNASPELKAALFRVLANQHGMNFVQAGVDPLGRPAIELWIQTEDQIHRHWFDPQSEQPMASEDATLNGTPIDRTIVERSGLVNSTDSVHPANPFFPPANEASTSSSLASPSGG